MTFEVGRSYPMYGGGTAKVIAAHDGRMTVRRTLPDGRTEIGICQADGASWCERLSLVAPEVIHG